MQIPLEKIDQLRERAGIGYREAKQILEQADGDLLEALIYLEGSPHGVGRCLSDWSRDISGRLCHFAAGLRQARFRVKVKDNTLVDLPATCGALGAMLFPKLAALGLVGTLFTRGTIEIKGGGTGGAVKRERQDKENLDKKENPGLGSD